MGPRATTESRPDTALTLVVIDDHEIVRAGIRDFLSASPRYRVIADAATARDAFRLIEEAKPDVVVMDLVLPGLDGVVATREILRRVPRARVLILSAHGQPRDVMDAMAAGAAGYALKSDEPETLLHAIDSVVRGERYISRSLAPRLTAADALDALSEREREVFRLSAECRGASEIARDLCLARKTVDTHLNRIHRKLKLRNQAELVRLAFKIGLVHSVRPGAAAPRGSDVAKD